VNDDASTTLDEFMITIVVDAYLN